MCLLFLIRQEEEIDIYWMQQWYQLDDWPGKSGRPSKCCVLLCDALLRL